MQKDKGGSVEKRTALWKDLTLQQIWISKTESYLLFWFGSSLQNTGSADFQLKTEKNSSLTHYSPLIQLLEYGWNFTISDLKMMVKSGLEDL